MIENVLGFVLNAAIQLLATIFVMRFYMRFCMIGGQAPLASIIAKLTNPFTKPLQLFLPPVRRFDIAAMIWAYIIISGYIIITLFGSLGWNFSWLVAFKLINFKILKIIMDLIFFSILARVILSWINPTEQSDINLQLFNPLTDWILEPVRRIVPTIGVIDISPIIVLLVLKFLENLLVSQLI